MMGERQSGQDSLFYCFSLETHVPDDHMLRAIDKFADLGFVRRHLKGHYSHTGRPSIDPELMIRMLLVGYCFGIRSERRLCEEVHLNLAYRWFCRLGLDAPVPDHSTFSKNRHGRFRDSNLLRELFETTVHRCIEEGLVGGENFAVDASIIAANANRSKGDDKPNLPKAVMNRRAVQEYIATLDETAFGAASGVPSKFLSPVDPAARWTRTSRSGRAKYSYSVNYLIDCEASVIMDVEGSGAIRQAEVNVTRDMIDRVEATYSIKPKRLAADTAYGSAPMLNWLVQDKNIEPHIPVFDKSARKDGTFERDDFTYDEANDRYVCPAGKDLKRYRVAGRRAKAAGNAPKDGTYRYRALKSDCDACLLKTKCCPNQPMRKVPRSIFEASRDVARQLKGTPDYEVMRHERKKVEMSFAHLKAIFKHGTTPTARPHRGQ